MKKTLTLFLIFGFIHSHSQTTSKCKLIFDKKLGIKVYTNVDSAGGPVDENALFEFLNTDSVHFKNIVKKYPNKQMVKIAYMIGLDGKTRLIKVLSPKKDVEIEENAKRIISSMPAHRPCMCGGTFVECYGHLSLPLYQKKD